MRSSPTDISASADSTAGATGASAGSELRGARRRMIRRRKLRDRMLPRHAGKLIQEMVQGMTCFQIVYQRLNRNARTSKYRCAPETLRRTGNQGIWQHASPPKGFGRMYINSWGASNEYHLPDRSETAAVLALEFW